MKRLATGQSPRVPSAARCQHRRIHLDRLPVNSREARANLVERENLAADIGIDDQLAALVDRLDQEMVRKGDAVEIETEAAADFEIHQRQRDRQSEPTIEDVVEKAVARVVVVLRVALEAFELEQKMRQQLHALDRILAGADDRLGLAGERRQLVEILVEGEGGIFFLL